MILASNNHSLGVLPKAWGLASVPPPDFARIQKGTEAEIYPCWACVFYEMGSPLLAEGGSCRDLYRDVTIQPLKITNMYFGKKSSCTARTSYHEELAQCKILGNI